MAKSNPWKSEIYIALVPKLIENIEPATDVRVEARAKRMITATQAEKISAYSTRSDQNRELLDALAKGNAKSFEMFIAILCDTNVVSEFNAIHGEAVPKLKSLIPSPAPPQQHGSTRSGAGAGGAGGGAGGAAGAVGAAGAGGAGAGASQCLYKSLGDVADLEELANTIEEYLTDPEKAQFAKLAVRRVDRDLVNTTTAIMTAMVNRDNDRFKHISSSSAPFVVLSWLKGKLGNVTMQTVLDLLVEAASAKKDTFTRMLNDPSLYK